MKRTLLAFLLALSAAGLRAENAASTAETKRDKAGFLVVPEATAPATPAPSAAPAAATPAPEAAPAAAYSAAVAYVLDDKHKLISGDRVSFEIKEDRTNAIPLLVAESAELDIPYIGRVSVAG